MTDSPNKNQREKKSETIEVRVSYTEKLAFMDACKQAGTTASHAIRDYIGDFLNPNEDKPKRRSPLMSLGVAAIVALMLAVVFLGQRAQTPPTTAERVLTHFDQDGDGYLTLADTDDGSPQAAETVAWLIEAADKNADARVDAGEIAALAEIMVEVQADNGGARPAGEEQILVVPSNLTPEQQRAFLEQSGAGAHLSLAERTRLLRILNALAEVNHAEGNTVARDGAIPK